MSSVPVALIGGDFQLLRQLGAGGMGTVYEARQLSTGNLRAVKLLNPELASNRGYVQRFVQEARIESRVASDHVVHVVASGFDAESGRAWIAMELLDGETLAARMERKGRFSTSEVDEIFGQLCHALAAAHAAGIVHRDIKPENLFLCVSRREGARFTLKVLDFGIAKIVAEVRKTSTLALGSPLWMAPEQADAKPLISPATDVWPLGLLAFEMLVGKPYWRTAEGEGASLTSFMKEMLIDPLVPASTRAAEWGWPGLLTPAFDAWFERCVCRDPAGRHPEAGAARRELSAVLPSVVSDVLSDSEPAPVRRATPAERASGADPIPSLPAVPGQNQPLTPVRSRTPRESGTAGPAHPESSSRGFSASQFVREPARNRKVWPFVVAGGLVLVATAITLSLALKQAPDGPPVSPESPGASAPAEPPSSPATLSPESPRPTALPAQAAASTAGVTQASGGWPIAVNLPEGRVEPDTYVGTSYLFNYPDTIGQTWRDAADRCRKQGSTYTLCSEAQWRRACSLDPKLGQYEAWVGSLRSNTEALVCGGSGCSTCKPARAHEAAARRLAPCCLLVAPVRDRERAKLRLEDYAAMLWLYYSSRYQGDMKFPQFAERVDLLDSKGITAPEAQEKLVRLRSAHPGDWAIPESCEASSRAKPAGTILECRDTSRRGAEIVSVLTRYVVEEPLRKLSAVQDLGVRFALTPP